jgi:hypothetical protein
MSDLASGLKNFVLNYGVATSPDYEQQWQTLENSRNPFAIVVMAHLKALETKVQIVL